VADTNNHRICKFVNGNMHVIAGNGIGGYVDGIATNSSFMHPSGIVVDPRDGSIFVADSGNKCIRRIYKNDIISDNNHLVPPQDTFPARVSSLSDSECSQPLCPFLMVSQNELKSLKDSLIHAYQGERENIINLIPIYLDFGLILNPKLSQEQLSLYIYTCEFPQERAVSPYHKLNSDLIHKERRRAEKWRFFMYYFLKALKNTQRIQPTECPELFRGVNADVVSLFPRKYIVGNTITWWTCTSTSTKLENIYTFLDKGNGTVFTITNVWFGRIIKEYSAHRYEEEVLLPPGSTFSIQSIIKEGGVQKIILSAIHPANDVTSPLIELFE